MALLDRGRDFRAHLLHDRTLACPAATCFEPLPRPCRRTLHGKGLDAVVAFLGSVLAGRPATQPNAKVIVREAQVTGGARPRASASRTCSIRGSNCFGFCGAFLGMHPPKTRTCRRCIDMVRRRRDGV